MRIILDLSLTFSTETAIETNFQKCRGPKNSKNLLVAKQGNINSKTR